MWHKVKRTFSALLTKPLELFSSKGNTLIIQVFPRKNILYVSYKGNIKSAYFHDDTLRHMFKGDHNFKKHTGRMFITAGQLLEQIINE